MLTVMTAAAMAGLMGTPHCMGMCGPFAASCSGRTSHSLAWLAGKTTTYAALGAVAGGLGTAVPGPSWLGGVVAGALVVWFAAALAGLVPEPSLGRGRLARLVGRNAARSDTAGRYLFGIAVGLLPCGLVYAALALAVATGSAPAGALVMLAFGVGTAPGLAAIAFGARRAVHPGIWARRAVASYVLIAGLWMVTSRLT